MKIIESLIEAMNAERQERKIKIKWPVSEVWVKPGDAKAERALKDFGEIVKLMGNVKGIKLLKRASKGMKEFAGGKLALGDVLEDEALVREFIRAFQMKRKEKRLDVIDRVERVVKSDKGTEAILRNFQKDINIATGSPWVRYEEPKTDVNVFSFEDRVIRFSIRKKG
jgi:hypothetical protein